MIDRRHPVLWLVLGTILTTMPSRADDLADRFRSPPDGARPWVYWMVMDGNFGPGGITEDLEAMKRVGIGGLIFYGGGCGHSQGPRSFHEPPLAAAFLACQPGSRPPRTGDYHARQSRLDRLRRALGQAGTFDAKARG
jgi:alpha-L-rhamnosidase